jgi:hypothetical protein
MYNNFPMDPNHLEGGFRPDDIKGVCKKYMNYHVMGQLNDGSQFDGIITDMDDEGVTMLVPEEIDADQMDRQFGYDYDYDYDDYGRPRRRRFRRFRRRRFPFFLLRRLLRYPYYYPYYGYGGGYY